MFFCVRALRGRKKNRKTLQSTMHKNNSNSPSTNIVGVHYRVGKKLGEGSFGVLYEGFEKKKEKKRKNKPSYSFYFVYFLFLFLFFFLKSIGLNLLNNQSVAIKFEPRKSDAPQLRDEYRTYKVLAGLRKAGEGKKNCFNCFA